MPTYTILVIWSLPFFLITDFTYPQSSPNKTITSSLDSDRLHRVELEVPTEPILQEKESDKRSTSDKPEIKITQSESEWKSCKSYFSTAGGLGWNKNSRPYNGLLKLSSQVVSSDGYYLVVF
jgi:hypothetical protein